MDLSGYRCEKLREDSELVLYRGDRSGTTASILLLMATSRSAEDSNIERLEREHELSQVLEAPWAIKPLALTRYEDRLALVLDDPGGRPLGPLLGVPLELGHFLEVAIGIAVALGEAHARNLIHKDIKPTNVFIGKSGQVSLTGFGFAIQQPREKQGPARPDEIAGSLAYMAPEQTGRMNRSVDARSDLYAMGVTFYEMLTGTLPFTASDPMEWIYCHTARLAPPPSVRVEKVPPILDLIILKLLAKNAEDRYQTAAGVEHDLRRCLADFRTGRRISSFDLAERDHSGQVVIPEVVYGRQAEIALLINEFEQVATSGRFKCVLLSGSPGVGKSSIVRELQRSLYTTRGLFARGKCDQYKREIPYLTLVNAFQGLIRQILGEGEAALERWRAALLSATGRNVDLMINLFPDLALVLGEQPSAPSISPQEAKREFHLVLGQFLRVFAQPEHPLVIFLDDMHWLDVATLELLEHLVSDQPIPYLLLIGAYRSNELEGAAGLRRTLKVFRASGDGPAEIVLAPLKRQEALQLVAGTLRMKPALVEPLAEAVFEKTQGNPFFAVQFLNMLSVEGMLIFDRLARIWTWDLPRIQSTRVADNVADLLAQQLYRFDGIQLDAITQFAAVGNVASRRSLSGVLSIPESEVDAALREFAVIGLIYRTEQGYAFSHDRIHESAYALIPESERAALHLKIGRLLLTQSGAEAEDTIFEIVNQLNRGAAEITSPKERQGLAELNLQAGKRAKAAAAYHAALDFLTTGISLLANESWKEQFRTAFELEFNHAECQFMVGERAFAEERFALLSKRCQNVNDIVLIAEKQVVVHNSLGRLDRAIDISLECLRRIGIVLPLHPTKEELATEYQTFLQKFGGLPAESVLALPAMQDTYWQQVMFVLEGLIATSGALNVDLQHLVLLRMINISIEHGLTHESAHAFMNFSGFLLGWRVGDFEMADKYGQIAMRLVDERGFDGYAARVFSVYSGTLGIFCVPIRSCYDVALRAVAAARDLRGITYTGFAFTCAVAAALGCGKSLAEVDSYAETAIAYARHQGFSLLAEIINVSRLYVLALRGLTSDIEICSDINISEEDNERLLSTTPHLWHALVRYKIRKLQLHYSAGNISACMDLISFLEPQIDPIRVFELVEYRFYSALTQAAYLRNVPREFWGADFESLMRNFNQIVKWCNRCPANYAERVAMVAAEIARLEGRELEAERYYEEAIRLAREQSLVHSEALANELASQFYEARGFEVIAEAYLANARACYLRWGANGKVRQIDQLRSHLRGDKIYRDVAMAGGKDRYQRIDMAAVVEMYQAVTREIVLDRLIERIMNAMVELAGAVRGVLLLPRLGKMQIVADAVAQQNGLRVSLRQHSGHDDELPQTILNYVTRTRDTIIIDDALAPNAHSSDPYILRAQPRSILCLPLIKQKRLVGILYLENNLSSHIFTQERLSILQLLASQAAISIENAELFLEIQTAQEQARRVGDELRRSFDMIPALTWRAGPTGLIEFFNKQWHDYTGIPQEETRGGSWLRGFHADDLDKVSDKWRHLLKFRTSGECEARMRRFDGSYRMFLVRVTPMMDDHGEVVAWHGSNTDIESLKRAEQAHEALAQVSRVTAMGELTVSIAHEVNQPLMAIVTNAATCLRWLSDEQLNIPEARLAAERIIADGHRAGDVVASIRALARKSPLQSTELNLNEVILEVLSLTRNEIDRHGIAAETQLSAGLGTVLGDRVQLQQVLLNLIMNGIEAMSAASHQPRYLKICSQQEGVDRIMVTIADTGPGLGKADSDEIFDAFFTTKPQGIGMGLAICRSIIGAHHGRLWATSNEHNGATFHFTLPMVSDNRFGEQH